MKRSVSSWLHKFADAGERAVSDELTRQGLTTADEKAEFVAMLLGDADDMSTTSRPFIWKSTYEDPVAQNPYVRDPVTQSIIVDVGLSPGHRAGSRPISALITSIRAMYFDPTPSNMLYQVH